MRSSLYPVQELRRRTLAWAVKLRVNPKVVRIQEMTRKWGSCSFRATVTLAIDLTDQEERFRDFVIVHELLHLRIPNHGRLFTTLLTAYVPGWRAFIPNGVREPLPARLGAGRRLRPPCCQVASMECAGVQK